MGFWTRISQTTQAVLEAGSGDLRRPIIKKHNQSNVRDLFVIGDLAGAPVIKLAMEQGVKVVEHIATLPEAKGNAERYGSDVFDLVVCGAGAAGLNAALEAKDQGMRCVVLEKGKIANTIEDFPKGKWVYAEPDDRPPNGKLWLDGATKEDLLARWSDIVNENELDVRTGRAVTSITKDGPLFNVESDGESQSIRARRVIIAIGQRGNPRKLGIPGEDREQVYHRLYSPGLYEDENILVVGGGNSAVEAALTLSERNNIVLSYRGEAFARVFKDNERKLDAAVVGGRIKVTFNSNVTEFGADEARLSIVRAGSAGEAEIQSVRYDHAFVLVGAELPVRFLQSAGIKLENSWDGNPALAIGLTALPYALLFFLWLALGFKSPDEMTFSPWLASLALILPALVLVFRGAKRDDRYAWLGFAFLVSMTIYGINKALWPYTMLFGQRDYIVINLYHGTDQQLAMLFNRGGPFWYTVLYCVVMTVFGIRAMKRWGFDRRDKFQIARYCTLIGSQWVLFFILPEFVWHVVIKGLGGSDAMARGYLAYGLAYPWPLYVESFNKGWGNAPDAQSLFWVAWGMFLTFVILPIVVVFHGKRFCSWVCGCGGLAETLGDRWRHLAPKGKESIRWEQMAWIVVALAVILTVFLIPYAALRLAESYQAGDTAKRMTAWYKLLVDVWAAGIVPVTLYPFLGGKVWCRYWCPL
ncbi:MAG: NAD(P)-binding domain-containing protein, partial [Phycisphaerales bacterium]